jgi:hypothetical protein
LVAGMPRSMNSSSAAASKRSLVEGLGLLMEISQEKCKCHLHFLKSVVIVVM